jgi:hypothetical protein
MRAVATLTVWRAHYSSLKMNVWPDALKMHLANAGGAVVIDRWLQKRQ